MPTISSSRVQPLVTPCTALNTRARVSPCTAACFSVSRLTCRAPSFVSSVMPSAINAETLPLGPSTRTVFPSTLYLTPEGSGITFLPMRDIESILFACESRRSSQAPSFHCSSGKILPSQNYLATTKGSLRNAEGPRLDGQSYQTSQSSSPPTPSRRA